jgi:hypothetical protein
LQSSVGLDHKDGRSDPLAIEPDTEDSVRSGRQFDPVRVGATAFVDVTIAIVVDVVTARLECGPQRITRERVFIASFDAVDACARDGRTHTKATTGWHDEVGFVRQSVAVVVTSVASLDPVV